MTGMTPWRSSETKRGAGVEMPLVMLQIVVREKHLGDALARFAEELFINGHQAGLPDRGAGLQFRRFRRPFFMSQNAHARAHRAGADDDDFLALRAQGGNLAGQLGHLRQVGLFAAVGEDAGAQFDDDAAGFDKRIAMHKPEEECRREDEK